MSLPICPCFVASWRTRRRLTCVARTVWSALDCVVRRNGARRRVAIGVMPTGLALCRVWCPLGLLYVTTWNRARTLPSQHATTWNRTRDLGLVTRNHMERQKGHCACNTYPRRPGQGTLPLQLATTWNDKRGIALALRNHVEQDSLFGLTAAFPSQCGINIDTNLWLSHLHVRHFFA